MSHLLQIMLAVVILIGMIWAYRYVLRRRHMEFLYNNKLVLTEDIANDVPEDMVYVGRIKTVRVLDDGKLAITIETESGHHADIYTDQPDQVGKFPTGQLQKYIGGMYFALAKMIVAKSNRTFTTKIVGADKSIIYLQNKYHERPFCIHVAHIGSIADNWSVGKKVKVRMENGKFHIGV